MFARGMNDYSALAQRVSMSIDGVRGCLLLSRDGMVLGAHPEGDAESHVRFAWVRFAAVGDPERSYIEFADQIWAFVRRGGYSAFADRGHGRAARRARGSARASPDDGGAKSLGRTGDDAVARDAVRAFRQAPDQPSQAGASARVRSRARPGSRSR